MKNLLIALLLTSLLISCQKPKVNDAKSNSAEKSNDEKIQHIVLCWLKDSGNKEQRQKVIDLSLSFKNIPGVIDVRAGEVIKSERSIVDSSYDVGIYMTFKSIEDLNAYLIHKDHVKAVTETLKPLSEKIQVYDFQNFQK